MSSKYNTNNSESERERKKRESTAVFQRHRTEQIITGQIRKVLKLLAENKKPSEIDLLVLQENPELVKKVTSNMTGRQEALKRKHDRDAEIYDTEFSVNHFTKEIAEKLISCKASGKHVLVYTGAGISTSADISDYRGPEGVWTKLNKKEKLEIGKPLVKAVPTKTHMVLKQLMDDGFITHIVSQNCDGLHTRSGIPKEKISELHGNMFAEYCGNSSCFLNPVYRVFDTTEFTGYRKHTTGRSCPKCRVGENDSKSAENKSSLRDTIIHFGEMNPTNVNYPYNWTKVLELINSKNVGCILTLGSSLKVLKSYDKLFPKASLKNPYDLFIVNLQWTPKDSFAKIKIHTKCDDFSEKLWQAVQNQNLTNNGGTSNLNVFKLQNDALWSLATPILSNEALTVNTLAIYDENKINEDCEYYKNSVNSGFLMPEKFETELKHISGLENPIVKPAWYGLGFKK